MISNNWSKNQTFWNYYFNFEIFCMKNLFTLYLTLFVSFCVFAQEGKLSKEDIKTVKEKAKQYMELGEYNKALEQYTILLRDQPENPEYNFQAGVVLFEGSFDLKT